MLLAAVLAGSIQAAPAVARADEEPRRLVFANRYSMQWSIAAPVPSGEVGLFLGSTLRPRIGRAGTLWRTAVGYELALNVGGADRGTVALSWGGNYGLVYHRHHVAALGYGGPHGRLFYQFGGGLVLWRSSLVALDADARLGVMLGSRRPNAVHGVVGGEVRLVGILDGVPLPHFGVFAGLFVF